jgi:T5SS/PEP-CTERM-associated repeat protein
MVPFALNLNQRMEASRIVRRNRMKQTTMHVAMVACLMFALVSVSNAAITPSPLDWSYITSSTPYVSGNWSAGDLQVGDAGTASLTIDGGSVVASAWSVISASGGVGEVTVTGDNSVWNGEEGLWLGDAAGGTLNIFDNGMFKTELAFGGFFAIGASSEVLMQTGGQMAIKGADTTSLETFLAKNTADGGENDNLKYWNGSAWDSMSNGSAGTDYTLHAGTVAEGLDGYGVLTVGAVTVPTPGTMIYVR